jgi:hypothetical protein
MVAVTVNNRPIDVPAIVKSGRVYLPLRTVFTALGATVTYDARQRIIVARNASQELRLPVASDPVKVFAGHAYVPLRFVAESMGASVAYDALTQTVRVTAKKVNVIGLTPAPDAVVSSAYPAIAATIAGANATSGDVSLQIDGEDVTALSTFDGSTITFLPRKALTRGRHTVTFSGHTLARDTFSSSWSFDTAMDPPPLDNSAPFTTFDYRLYADRNAFYSGDWMHFTLIAPPGGSARLQLCNLGYQYPLNNGGYGNVYQIDVPAPIGYWIPSCAVTAVYTSWNGAKVFVPVPYVIAIYTRAEPRQRPTPSPAPKPRRIAPMPHRTEPMPMPKPASKATAAPRSLPQGRPSPRTTPGR